MTVIQRMRLRFRLLSLALLLAAGMGAAQTGDFDWSAVPWACPGVKHARIHVETPRPLDVSCVRVELDTPGLSFHTTGRAAEWVENSTETRRQTTRNFLLQSRAEGRKMVMAVNGDAFSLTGHFSQEILTNLSGFAVSEGLLVSPGNGSASLVIHGDNTAFMASTNAATPTAGIHTAISGFGFCLTNGNPLPSGTDLHPRTGTGLSQDGRIVLLLTADGRRWASQGCTTNELGQWLRHFGAHTGINMDGGGSTTLARWNPSAEPGGKAELVNNPVGDGINWMDFTPEQEALWYAPSERTNGNNLGVVVAHLDIAVQPFSGSIVEGGCHRFEVGVMDARGDASYAWYKDGQPVPGAGNNPVLDVCPADRADQGAYTCRVTDQYMTVETLPATLAVEARTPVGPAAAALLCLLLAAAGAARVQEAAGSRSCAGGKRRSAARFT